VRVLACMASCNGSRASAPGVKGRLRSKAAEARMTLGISPSLPEALTPVLVMQRNYLSSRCSRTVSRKCGIYGAAKGLLVVANFGEFLFHALLGFIGTPLEIKRPRRLAYKQASIFRGILLAT
jgi:hypothetical protein